MPLVRGPVALLCTLLLSGCPGEGRSSADEPLAQPSSILLLGIDGFEWRVLLPMVQSGEAPHLARLMEQGRFGTLQTIEPMRSPVIWTTVATGKVPAKHGITGFTYPFETEAGTEQRLFSSGHRRTMAFWNILSKAGLGVDVIGWWITYPAEPIRGLMVSQTNTSEALRKGAVEVGVPNQVSPPDLEAAVLEDLALVDAGLAGVVREHYGDPRPPLGELEALAWRNSQWSFRADETYQRIARRRIGTSGARLTAVYMGAPDVVGHRFWRHAFPEEFEHPPEAHQLENFGGLLAATYRRADRALGELLEAAPPDTTVFVVSDHGMQARDPSERFGQGEKRLSGRHVNASLLIAAGPGIRPPEAVPDLSGVERETLPRLGKVTDLTPTLLTLLGLPVGRDMDGEPLTELLDPRWLEEQPPRWIASHDTEEWLEARAPLEDPRPSRESRLEQLRALGYIE